MRYRRAWMPGGTFFFTVCLQDRQSIMLVDRIDVLRNAMRTVQSRHPFIVNAAVVLPDHLHMIWILPEGDANFAMRWALIKSAFTRESGKAGHVTARRGQRQRTVWQRRYWEHCIRDERDYQRHVDYIHYNPVKHGYVDTPAQWPYSSIHRYIRQGLLEPDWGAAYSDDPVMAGE